MASDAINGIGYNLHSLISSEDTDFLIRNNGDQVKIHTLKAKNVGLYFSASWSVHCSSFIPILLEVYEQLTSKVDFEVIFISSDRDEESFNDYFSTMPWLSIPYVDSETKKHLNDVFNVKGLPHLVVLDANGKVSTKNGVEQIMDYGADAYPFTSENIKFLKEEQREAKRNQTISSILVSPLRNYVISNNGNQIPISELEGKLIGLYFSVYALDSCVEFTSTLVEIYKELKEKGQNFEIVSVSLDDEDEDFKEAFKTMPWLALPFKDVKCEKLVRYFALTSLPTLLIIGQDGKTLNPNVAYLIEEYGIDAYPFTSEKLAKFAEIEKARLEAQTLESLLISGERDFVIEKSGAKIPVSKLVGKNILFYFSAKRCPSCHVLLPKLIEAYQEIKQKGIELEIIFISRDKDRDSFEELFSGMPWLALPFEDERKKFLAQRFKIKYLPTVVAVNQSGRTVSTDAHILIEAHGAGAYPFTEEHIKHLEEEETKGWPEKLKYELHEEHELVPTRRAAYSCDGCNEMGDGWCFSCVKCSFDMHPKCALKKSEDEGKEGWVCDGDVCKA